MNLCTLAAVKAYINQADTKLDAQISQLIPAASAVAMQFCQRTFQRNVHSSVRFNGRGTKAMMLPDVPIISVQALQIYTDVIAASPDGVQAGYMFDDKSLYLVGCFLGWSEFPRGAQNVLVSWTAGLTTSETDFIPANPGPYTVTPSFGAGFMNVGGGALISTAGWAAVDRGVVYTGSGQALVAVGSNPAQGQYSYAAGVYTFNAADAGQQVTLSYDFVPADVAQAVVEMVYLKIQQRPNLGVRSRSLAGENVAYETNDMTPSVKAMLQPWRRYVPIGP